MAASRSPSPRSDGSGSPPTTPITPRSKLRALLATVGDSSDEEAASPSRRPKKDAAAQLPAAVRAASPMSTGDGSDDDDEDEIVQPRGRLASRMKGGGASRANGDSVPEGDAREHAEKTRDSAADKGVETDQDGAEDEGEAVASRPRKLTNRAPRRSDTPEIDARQREESPIVASQNDDQSTLSQGEPDGSGSDPDLPSKPLRNERFLALIAKKRAERLAREAEKEQKKAARLAAQQAAEEDLVDDEDSDITDDEGGRKLTQEGRPAARKASKKALEEMNRETQRMSRNLQLAHEAKTRKKITKASLFERFNFRPEGAPAEEKLSGSSRPATPVSAHHSDAEMRDAETPATSPPPALEKIATPSKSTGVIVEAESPTREDGNDEPPPLEDVLAALRNKKLDKGKGVATTRDLDDKPEAPPTAAKPRARVNLPTLTSFATVDSDDELIITETKKSRVDAIFDRMPAKKEKESRSMLVLRNLAHVRSPGKEAKHKKDKQSLTAGELHDALMQRARNQAKLERDRRLDVLKAKGVHIQTEEEREKEMADIEDIVARARREAEEIMQREREAAKKEKKQSGEVDPLAWDDSGDDEYEERGEPSEVELSGSEEDEDLATDAGEDDVDDGASERDSATAGLFVNEAESADESDDEPAEVPEEHQGSTATDSDDEMVQLPARKARRAKKHVTILSDDEEEKEMEATPRRPKVAFPESPYVQPTSDSPQVPTSVLRSATKPFIPGMPVNVGSAAGLGLTQIFAGTMDDSQAGPPCPSPSQPMPTFDNFPDSNFSQTAPDHGDDMIMNSQPTQQELTQPLETLTQGVRIHFTQSQMHGFDSLIRDQAATQLSELVEPSQDGGFRNYTPLKERFIEAPPSTIETVALDRSQPELLQHDSPLLQRGGKLRRKFMEPAVGSDEEGGGKAAEAMDVSGEEEDEFSAAATAFSVVRDAAAKKKKQDALDAFNKKKSRAKDMVEEQAEESEDDYAGLGGADGEDSDNESAASVKDMIDDEHKSNQADDAKLAALYADRERASDEKQVEKLFRDITSGMLRRKRGADYDLSDSDDGGEARRRLKRRQFAKMQRALFADERISKVAENPRNQAFLRTIEDRGSDEEMDFLFEAPPAARDDEPQGASPDGAIPDSQPEQQAKQPLKPVGNNRPPAAQRRTREGKKKPSNIGEIRESLSNLLEDSSPSVVPATDHGSDSDDEADDERPGSSTSGSSNKENRQPHPRRGRHAGAVVDRISLKRAGSSSLSTSARMAFAAPAAADGVFKVPALLRRATTNSLGSSSSGSGSGASASGAAGRSAGGFADEGKIKKSAGKRSGINYFARENERRAALAEGEKRREAKKFKGAEGRSRVVGGLFGAGKFE